jgi:hypothetical protein
VAVRALGVGGGRAGAGTAHLGGGDQRPPASRGLTPGQAAQAYGRLPLAFEANLGQADPAVRFTAAGAGYRLALTPTEAVLRVEGTAVRLSALGANPDAAMESLEPLAGTVNHIHGRDPARWVLGAPTFGRVAVRQAYPGIDMVWYGTNDGHLEYDFALAPGADPAPIRLGIGGAQSLRLD